MHTKKLPIGIYEKALPVDIDWHERLTLAAEAGFDFVEISCDESAERQARMDWSAAQKADLRHAIAESGTPVLTMCLSAHRRLALGSADDAIRQQGMDLFREAIHFCADVGIRTIQVAGYWDYYGEVDKDTERRYIDGVAQGTEWACRAGVMLGVETMEGENVVDSITRAMYIVNLIDSPWFQVYPDLGNIAAHGYDLNTELERGRGHIVGVHAKDSRPGEPRRVPFGEGVVPFAQAFARLASINYTGPVMIEMWNDNSPDSMQIIQQSRQWVLERMAEGGLLEKERAV
ncbi:MAG: L-ribulose-5-phosphate 3-epimerase [Chloroflexota bacterium]